jgi:hypothetical protein
MAMDGGKDEQETRPRSYPLAVTRPFPPGGEDERVFGFGAPGPELQAVKEAERPFCVIADPAHLGVPLPTLDPEQASFGNTLWVGEWLASVDLPPQAGDPVSAPVLILKFGEGEVRALLADPTEWTAGETFLPLGEGREPADYAAAFQARVADGLDRAQDWTSIYAGLSTLDGGWWSGFLVLGARIGPEGLPMQLGFLKADPAIEGLTFDFLWSVQGPPESTPMGGIVDYRAPPSGSATDGPRVKLRDLQLVVFYSGLRLFRCAVDVALASGATLSLSGAYRQADGRSSYVFTPAGDEVCSLDRGVEGTQSIAAWLEPLLAGAWLFDTDPAEPLSLRVEGSYCVRIAEGLAPAEMPMLLLPAQPMRGLSSAALAKRLGEHVDGWRRQMALAEGAELRFRLTLVSQGGPFVTLPPVGLDLARVAAP